MRDIFRDLRDAVDLHVHPAPDSFPRLLDDVEIAEDARAKRMRAVVLKGHTSITADRAAIATRMVPGVEVYGGVVLNPAVGGLNPEAVRASIAMGGRVVWGPTMWAQQHVDYVRRHPMSGYRAIGMRFPARGVTLFRDAARTDVDPRIYEILELVREADGIFATGHFDRDEVGVILDHAERIGLRKIVVTHPNYQVLEFTLEDCRRFAARGAYLEWCYLPLTPHWMLRSPESWGLGEIAAAIRELGAERCLLSSDLGQLHNAPPAEGLREFIQALREEGVADKDLETMTRATPARLLGLE